MISNIALDSKCKFFISYTSNTRNRSLNSEVFWKIPALKKLAKVLENT